MISKSAIFEFINRFFSWPILKDHAVHRDYGSRAVTAMPAVNQYRLFSTIDAVKRFCDQRVIDFSRIHRHSI